MAATGICGTDLHIMDDEYAVSMPVVMGHEVTGVVDELGAGVASSWVGRRVAVEPTSRHVRPVFTVGRDNGTCAPGVCR